ncbi:MAG: NAD(P)H-dependent oxidoreductase subunit E [Verrucomicrobia bacterium]|jgi:NADH-quinone oxidoreductase subunit E|nr:NAD(P)H-dependent oxidoreductase subunit E [Verrucomicrobiota bacterium]
MNAVATTPTEPLAESAIDAIIAKYQRRTGDLLNVLEDIQDAHPDRYLPVTTLRQVAVKMRIAASQIFSVVTFYSFFNLEPQGRHCITVCRGTACHTRGSRQLMQCLRRETSLLDENGDSGEGSFTTADLNLTVRTVACFGQCALAPVVAVDEDIYGYVTDLKLRELVKTVREPNEEMRTS